MVKSMKSAALRGSLFAAVHWVYQKFLIDLFRTKIMVIKMQRISGFLIIPRLLLRRHPFQPVALTRAFSSHRTCSINLVRKCAPAYLGLSNIATTLSIV